MCMYSMHMCACMYFLLDFTIVVFWQLMAELLATYFLIFSGCGVIMVNIDKKNPVGMPGIAIVWGAVVMVMIYTVGHISGAHINPAVTIAFASCKRFPWKEVILILIMNCSFFDVYLDSNLCS